MLGTRPALGRFFRDDEDQVPGERPVVVLSHAFWQQRFNGDPAILDRAAAPQQPEFAVIGVAEDGFQGSSMIGTDLWVPMAMVQVVRGRADSSMLTEVNGRLARGDRPAQAWRRPWRRRKRSSTR